MERDELEAIVRTHQAEVYRYVCYLGAPADAAEDIVQDTFLVAFRKGLPSDASDLHTRAAWLRGIARNLFLQYCTQKRTSRLKVDSEVVEQAEDVWQSRFLRDGDGFDYTDALRKCLETLPDQHRRVLDLRYADRKTRKQMASLLNMSTDGVKSLLRRIRANLADCIAKRLELERSL